MNIHFMNCCGFILSILNNPYMPIGKNITYFHL